MRGLSLLRMIPIAKYKKSIIYIAAFILLIFANILLSPIALRLDLSKGKAYTLSQSTKKVLHNIDKPVTINFFVSSDLPTRLLPLKREVVDLLNEYKRQGGGKIQINLLDPKKDQSALAKVKEARIPELQFSQVDQDKYAVTSSYFGASIEKEGAREVLPQITEVGTLEYNLTAAVYKLTRKDIPKVGIVGKDTEEGVTMLGNVLSQQFQVEAVGVATEEATLSIDPSYKTLLMFDSPQKEYTREEIDSLKEYLNKGGKVIAFIDGVSIDENLSTAIPKHNLFPFLKEYGITINSNLVLSTSAELVNFGNDLVSYLVPYPFWIKTDEFDTKVSYFSNVTQLTFPWTSSITVGKIKNGEVKKLVETTKNSWEQTATYTLSPQNIPQPQEKDLKQFVIGAQVKNKNDGTLIVIPSSRFVEDRYLSRTSDNIGFILNVVNELASGGALSGIRQRVVSFYPLPDLPENRKDIFRYANILLLPALFALYGVYRLMRRR